MSDLQMEVIEVDAIVLALLEKHLIDGGVIFWIRNIQF